MCLGEKRLVTVPPRMGWTNNNAHHDTIRFILLSYGREYLAKDHEFLAENGIYVKIGK